MINNIKSLIVQLSTASNTTDLVDAVIASCKAHLENKINTEQFSYAVSPALDKVGLTDCYIEVFYDREEIVSHLFLEANEGAFMLVNVNTTLGADTYRQATGYDADATSTRWILIDTEDDNLTKRSRDANSLTQLRNAIKEFSN